LAPAQTPTSLILKRQVPGHCSKLGDRIVEIDGRPTESPDFGTLCGILDSLGLFGSGDEPIVVTVRRDRQLEKVTVPKTPLLAARKGAAVPSIQ
jgi:hypothetical protein